VDDGEGHSQKRNPQQLSNRTVTKKNVHRSDKQDMAARLACGATFLEVSKEEQNKYGK
jgi:hypothetical protein